jgi:hypothetical protein
MVAPMPSGPLINIARHGSYLCVSYELRVTARCLAEDLGRPGDDPFSQLANHEIVVAFINRRRDSPEDTRQVAPLSTGRTVYRLAYGNRHRGATWYDEANRVVWLLAYAQHDFAAAGDAFPYFKELDAADRLLPTADDYRALFEARAARFAEVVAFEAANLLSAARASPGTERRAIIAGQLAVGLVVEIVEDLEGVEEITVALRLEDLTPESLPILLAALFPDSAFDDIQTPISLAGRVLGKNEIGYRVLIER